MKNINVKLRKSIDYTEIVVIGDIYADDFITIINSLCKRRSELKLLWNFVEADMKYISAEDCQSINEFVKNKIALKHIMRVAFVCSRELEFSLCRIYTSNTEILDLPFESRVFWSKYSACSWLKRDYFENFNTVNNKRISVKKFY